MARALLVLVMLAVVGCTDGDAPPVLHTDFGMPADLGTGGKD